MYLWAGSDSSLSEYLLKISKFEEISQKDFEGSDPQAALVFGGDTQQERLPRLLAVQDGIGVVAIQGTLTDSDNWYNKYAGLVAYSEIREAVILALSRADVKEILYYVKSPGGVVSGLHDTYEFIAKASKLKPSTMFTDSMVASAGYWVMSPVKNKIISADAIAGSIGIISVHTEYSKMLEKDGITKRVFRGGKFKQIDNSIEPLTKEAIKTVQDRIDYTYGLFVQSVADGLSKSYQEVENKMAQGKVFIGQQAVDAGLVDKVDNFDAVLNKIYSRVNKQPEGGNLMKVKSALTPQQMAAVAAGVNPSDIKLTLPATDAKGAPDTSTDDKGAPDTSTDDKGAPDTSTDAKGAPDTSTDAKADSEPAKDNLTSSINLLKEQLAEKDDKLFTAKIELKAAEEKISTFASAEISFKKIVGQVTNNMQIALGMPVTVEIEALGSQALLDLHAAIKPSFVASFPVGGVSSGDPEDTTNKVVSEVSKKSQAALASMSGLR